MNNIMDSSPTVSYLEMHEILAETENLFLEDSSVFETLVENESCISTHSRLNLLSSNGKIVSAKKLDPVHLAEAVAMIVHLARISTSLKEKPLSLVLFMYRKAVQHCCKVGTPFKASFLSMADMILSERPEQRYAMQMAIHRVLDGEVACV
jgi:hypothetical protein